MFTDQLRYQITDTESDFKPEKKKKYRWTWCTEQRGPPTYHTTTGDQLISKMKKRQRLQWFFFGAQKIRCVFQKKKDKTTLSLVKVKRTLCQAFWPSKTEISSTTQIQKNVCSYHTYSILLPTFVWIICCWVNQDDVVNSSQAQWELCHYF